ncbi:MAG: hypothetical protein JWO45_1392 [Spartobacteria bacterium]|nr:hypothetical protein [Spartobacteria bacterium]
MTDTPLVILGFDAGDPGLLREWAQRGYLPTVASIMQRGCWGKTTGSELALEHGVWHSIFSGLSRAQHGCYYLRCLKPRSYDLEIVHGSDVNAPPFWASWLDGGKRVVAVDLHDIPPTPGVAGLQLGNWGIHRGWFSRAKVEQPCSVPSDLLAEVTRKFGPPIQIIESPQADPNKNRRILGDLLRRIERKGAICRHLVQRGAADVVAICFGESHTAGHQFWRYRAEALPPGQMDDAPFAEAIRQVYQSIDREMGLILAQLPSSANVFVLSSVGLADHYPTGGLLEDFCRQLGYQVPAKSDPIPLHPMAVARRMLPEEWRVALSRHLPREKREGLLARQFRNSTDWRKTTAFATPSPYTGFLHVNLKGRQPQGIVEPGAQYEALLNRLETDLSQLIDPQTGGTAIEQVARTAEIYGPSATEVLPDLIVHWKSCRHFVEKVVHPRAILTQQKPEFFRDTDHAPHGFIAAAGPAISNHGEIPDIDVLDLAPTFLALLNQTKRQEMTGEIADNLFNGAATGRRQ